MHDLIDVEGNFYTYENFCKIYNINTPVTIFLGMKTAIIYNFPKIRNIEKDLVLPFIPSCLVILKKHRKGVRDMYKIFISSLKENKKYITKWKSELQLVDEIEIEQLTSLVFTYTSDVTLRWFQYRISHRILATNELLFKMKILNNKMCSFCKAETENIEHLFIGCIKVENLWNDINKWLYEKCSYIINYTKYELLFGKLGKNCESTNMIVLLVKYYIYKSRCKGQILFFPTVKKEIIEYLDIERYLYYMKGKSSKFFIRWKLYEQLFVNP